MLLDSKALSLAATDNPFCSQFAKVDLNFFRETEKKLSSLHRHEHAANQGVLQLNPGHDAEMSSEVA